MCFFSNEKVRSETLKQISHHITLDRTVPHPVSKLITTKGTGFALTGLLKHTALERGVSTEHSQASGSKEEREKG